MLLTAFTLFHVALSLVGIGSGLVVLYGLLVSKWSSGWNTLFLITTVATSVTGFLFSGPSLLAVACGRYSVAGCPGDSDCRALSFSSCGQLVQNVRDHSSNCTVFERLCFGGTDVRKDTGTEGARTDSIRGAIQADSTCGVGGVYCAYDSRRGQVPQRAAPGDMREEGKPSSKSG